MRKALNPFNIGCWSCFPSREESMGWAIVGLLFAAAAIAVISLL